MHNLTPEQPDGLMRSAVGPAGIRSPRTYTRKEIAAGRRLGLVNGRENHDELGGPLFWATGDFWPDRVRQKLEDYRTVIEAIEREWGKAWD